MGIDGGFDMVPRLSKSLPDKQNWQAFLDEVRETYQSDPDVEFKTYYVDFHAAEHPRLPLEGHKFLRFSSKIPGRGGEQADQYIQTVARIARSYFGARIRAWNEMAEEYGHYGWSEVIESEESYEEQDPPDSTADAIPSEQGHDQENASDMPCYEIRPILGKGKGLVARSGIAKGTRILDEEPLFALASAASSLDSTVLSKVKILSKDQQRRYLSLHNNHKGKNIFTGIFRTNALPCGPDSIVGAVYPTICLINHACDPNSHHSWNSSRGRESILATRYIKVGEEITISYGKDETSAARRAELRSSFGFDCSCSVCSLSPSEMQLSDSLRRRIEQLDEAIGDGNRVMNKPVEALAFCREMLRVLQQEYNGSTTTLEARLYYDAFQIAITHGDQARASVFTGRAYETRVICEGEDIPGTADMKGFRDNPTKHRNFVVSKRWRTSKTAVSKGLEEEAFENWLWRSQ